MPINERPTAAARRRFENFIKLNECYESQICISTIAFRKELMIPILKLIKDLEKEKDES